MNLNKEHRQQFVNGVMSDVPSVNYKALVESAMTNDILNAGMDTNTKSGVEIKTALKSDVLRPLILNGVVSISAREFLEAGKRDVSNFPCINGGYNHAKGLYNFGLRLTSYRGYAPSHDAIQEVISLATKMQKQHDQREEMNTRLTTMIGSCKTRKQAVAMFPELEKYLPEEVKKESFPIVASNVIADLVKAGWHAGQAVAA